MLDPPTQRRTQMSDNQQILKPPTENPKRSPEAEAIVTYMKAIDDSCREILISEGISEEDLYHLDQKHLEANR